MAHSRSATINGRRHLRQMTPLDPDQAGRMVLDATLAIMSRDTWLFAISVVWLVVLVTGVIFMTFAH